MSYLNQIKFGDSAFDPEDAHGLIAFAADLALSAKSPEQTRAALRAWLHGAKWTVDNNPDFPYGVGSIADILIAALELLDAGRTSALLQKSLQPSSSGQDLVIAAKARAVAAVDLLVEVSGRGVSDSLRIVSDRNGMGREKLSALRRHVHTGKTSLAVCAAYPAQRANLWEAVKQGTRMAAAMKPDHDIPGSYYFSAILRRDRFILSAFKK